MTRLTDQQRAQVEECKNLLRTGQTEKQLIARGYVAQAVREAKQEIEGGT